MFEDERAFVAAHFKDAARGHAVAEAWVEEARIVDAKLADHGEVGGHFCGAIGGDGDRLAADQDIKSAGIEDQLALVAVQLLPKIRDFVGADLGEGDDACRGLGAVADERRVFRRQVDGEAAAVVDQGRGVDKGVSAWRARRASSLSAAWPRRKRIWFRRRPGAIFTEKERGQISA